MIAADGRETQTLSGGVAGIGPLPAFELPAAGGGRVRSWDFKGRTALVVWLAGAGVSDAALGEVADREPEIRQEGAELVIILQAPLDKAEGLRERARLRGPILADPDGRIHARFEAEQPTLLVADRDGTIYWRAPVDGERPDLDEALSWLEYINILEPECGSCVPAWPVA